MWYLHLWYLQPINNRTMKHYWLLQCYQIEEDIKRADAELCIYLAELATLLQAEKKVNDTEVFIDQLKAYSGEKRQAATSCIEIADLLDTMKEEVVKESIKGMESAAIQIITSEISRCSASDIELLGDKKNQIQFCKNELLNRIVKETDRIEHRKNQRINRKTELHCFRNQ